MPCIRLDAVLLIVCKSHFSIVIVWFAINFYSDDTLAFSIVHALL